MKFVRGTSACFTSKRVTIFTRIILFVAFASYLSACSSTKNVAYFRDIPDSVKSQTIAQAVYKTPTVQVDDILQITVQTLDPGANTQINQPNSSSWPLVGNNSGSGGNPSSSGANPGSAVSGFVVDKDGYIELPLVGKILVKDKTTDEVRDTVRAKASEFYKSPVVNVRLANFKVTVLGEVNRPSTYIMPTEKVTLLDAIGMAGDLTIYGKRENIMVIRDSDGKKEFARFNLNNSNLFTSPFYYLKQGDVVYVEPNKSKIIATDGARLRNVTIISSVLAVLIVALTRIK